MRASIRWTLNVEFGESNNRARTQAAYGPWPWPLLRADIAVAGRVDRSM